MHQIFKRSHPSVSEHSSQLCECAGWVGVGVCNICVCVCVCVCVRERKREREWRRMLACVTSTLYNLLLLHSFLTYRFALWMWTTVNEKLKETRPVQTSFKIDVTPWILTYYKYKLFIVRYCIQIKIIKI